MDQGGANHPGEPSPAQVERPAKNHAFDSDKGYSKHMHVHSNVCLFCKNSIRPWPTCMSTLAQTSRKLVAWSTAVAHELLLCDQSSHLQFCTMAVIACFSRTCLMLSPGSKADNNAEGIYNVRSKPARPGCSVLAALQASGSKTQGSGTSQMLQTWGPGYQLSDSRVSHACWDT